MMKTAAALFVTAALLAGCGGDHLSWCYNSGDGRVAAGYNSSCPGGEAERPPAAKEDAAQGEENARDEVETGLV